MKLGASSEAYICCYRAANEERIRRDQTRSNAKRWARKPWGRTVTEYFDACLKGEWPYDFGDDPSFFCYRKYRVVGGRLTWGVCRRDVRSRCRIGDLVVFISFLEKSRRIDYYLSAWATVESKTDHFTIARNTHLYARYLNSLLVRENGGFRWQEYHPNPKRWFWHKDWLKRMSTPRICNHHLFKKITAREFISDTEIPRLGRHLTYVIFGDVHMIPDPVLIATWKRTGKPWEKWRSPRPITGFQKLLSRSLRTANRQRPHRHIRLSLTHRRRAELLNSLQACVCCQRASGETWNARRRMSASGKFPGRNSC
jgi:hypothetical protein